MLSIDVLKITLHSAAAEEIIKNYITFLDPGGINYVTVVGPTVMLCSFILGKIAIQSSAKTNIQLQNDPPIQKPCLRNIIDLR